MTEIILEHALGKACLPPAGSTGNASTAIVEHDILLEDYETLLVVISKLFHDSSNVPSVRFAILREDGSTDIYDRDVFAGTNALVRNHAAGEVNLPVDDTSEYCVREGAVGTLWASIGFTPLTFAGLGDISKLIPLGNDPDSGECAIAAASSTAGDTWRLSFLAYNGTTPSAQYDLTLPSALDGYSLLYVARYYNTIHMLFSDGTHFRYVTAEFTWDTEGNAITATNELSAVVDMPALGYATPYGYLYSASGSTLSKFYNLDASIDTYTAPATITELLTFHSGECVVKCSNGKTYFFKGGEFLIIPNMDRELVNDVRFNHSYSEGGPT